MTLYMQRTKKMVAVFGILAVLFAGAASVRAQVNDDAYYTPGSFGSSDPDCDNEECLPAGPTKTTPNVFNGDNSGMFGGGSGSGTGGVGSSTTAPGLTTGLNGGNQTAVIPAIDVKLQNPNCNDIKTLGDLFNFASCIISKSIIPLIIILSVTVFLWGIVKFMMNTADVAKRKEGKQFMIWGIVAIFVIVTYYGIVQLFQTTVGLKNSQIPIPQLQQ